MQIGTMDCCVSCGFFARISRDVVPMTKTDVLLKKRKIGAYLAYLIYWMNNQLDPIV